MYIVGVSLLAARGKGPEAVSYVTEIRDVVARVTDQPCYGWSVVVGAPIGSLGVSFRVETIAELVENQQRLIADPVYQGLVGDSADLLVGPAETTISQVIAATATGDPKPLAVLTNATMATGRQSSALEWANEILEHATAVTGNGGVLATSAAGSFNDISWIFGLDSPEEWDNANGRIQSDPEYLAKLDSSEGLFVEGSGQRVILAQLP